MTEIKDFLKKHFESINLCFVAVMYALSCFHYVFTIFTLMYLFVICSFMKTEQIVKIHILTRIFHESIQFDARLIYWVLDWFVFLYLKNWLIDIFKHKQKMNYKVFVLIILISVYNAFTPIYKPTFLDVISDACKVLAVYFIYEKRDKLNFVSMARVFCYGMVFSSFFGLVYNQIMGRIFLDMYNVVRYRSLFIHPNILCDFTLMALVILFALQYYDKISMPEFCVLVILNFAFGYATIARNFVFMFGVIYAIYVVLYLLKHRKDGLKYILTLTAIILAICLLLEQQTYYYYIRIKFSYEVGGAETTLEIDKTSEWWKRMLVGQEHYDPGRLGLWMLYLSRIFETFKSFMFGYGIKAPFIGTMPTHNILLSKLYKSGFVGLMLSVIAILMMIDYKELKKYKKYLGVFMMAVGYIGVMLINNNTLVTAMAVIIIAAFMFVYKQTKSKKEEMIESRNKMIEILKR